MSNIRVLLIFLLFPTAMMVMAMKDKVKEREPDLFHDEAMYDNAIDLLIILTGLFDLFKYCLLIYIF